MLARLHLCKTVDVSASWWRAERWRLASRSWPKSWSCQCRWEKRYIPRTDPSMWEFCVDYCVTGNLQYFFIRVMGQSAGKGHAWTSSCCGGGSVRTDVVVWSHVCSVWCQDSASKLNSFTVRIMGWSYFLLMTGFGHKIRLFWRLHSKTLVPNYVRTSCLEHCSNREHEWCHCSTTTSLRCVGRGEN